MEKIENRNVSKSWQLTPKYIWVVDSKRGSLAYFHMITWFKCYTRIVGFLGSVVCSQFYLFYSVYLIFPLLLCVVFGNCLVSVNICDNIFYESSNWALPFFPSPVWVRIASLIDQTSCNDLKSWKWAFKLSLLFYLFWLLGHNYSPYIIFFHTHTHIYFAVGMTINKNF